MERERKNLCAYAVYVCMLQIYILQNTYMYYLEPYTAHYRKNIILICPMNNI